MRRSAWLCSPHGNLLPCARCARERRGRVARAFVIGCLLVFAVLVAFGLRRIGAP